MALPDELYRETILDHYHNPRNQGILDHPNVEVEGVNPLCGDELTLYMNIQDGTIADIRLKSHGCSISTSSGSMMTEIIQGAKLDKAEEYISLFKTMMLDKEDVSLPEELEDLESLRGVKKFPVRIKCAVLPWNTLAEGIATARREYMVKTKRTLRGKTVTTE